MFDAAKLPPATYLHCILKDNAKQNKSMVLEYKIKKDAAKFR